MRRRDFLGATLSPLVAGGAPAWAVSSDATSAPPAPGVKPQDIFLDYNRKDSAESAAGGELFQFLGRMLMDHPEFTLGITFNGDPEKASAHFLVGRTPATEQLIATGKIEDPAKKHPEAYIVRAVDLGGKTVVAFLGGTGIATLYAAYHYLEKYCGCGFYWDGDHVPRRETVPARGVNIAAEPYFRERMCMNLTLYWYSAPWWEWTDWKRYLDWTLKARFNILTLWDTPGEDVVWKKVWKRFGVEIADSSWSGPPYGIFAPIKYQVRGPCSDAWREGQCALTQKIIKYIRERGMRTLAPAVPGIVPPEYAAVHPEARTFELSWNHLPKQRYLHPLSPEYQEVGKAFLEEYIALYGNDHLYWLENYLECDIVGPEELQREVRREIQAANFKVMDAVDPQGVGVFSAWTYLAAPHDWSPPLMKESLERLPAERVRVLDQFAEMLPEYQRAEYFQGRPWHFGVVYAFGGLTQMHGSLAMMENQVHSVVDDPKAKQCVGFYPNEETIRHNYFYYDFLCRLGWNPQEVDLRSYTRDYARQRYGESAAPAMLSALGELLASVYGSDDQTQPAYWHRLGRNPGNLHLMESYRASFLPHLRKALEHALEAAPLQKSNSLYRHDLNDIARQYLAELFGAHVIKLDAAHADLDKAAFERQAALLESLMIAIEELLSHDDFYWISPWIRQARTLPGAPADVDVRARDILTLWAGVIRDYACRDYYELVQGYYRPRVSAYIAALRESLGMNQRRLYDPVALDIQYDEIEKGWVEKGFPLVVAPDGFVALLAAGVRYQAARYTREGKGWTRAGVEGEHANNLFALELGKDGQTLVYQSSTASRPVEWYGARLQGASLTHVVPVTELNPGFAKKAAAKSEIVRWKGALEEEVEGVLYYPQQYEAGKKYPLVVMIHGGPTAADMDSWSQGWAYPVNLYTQRGALVLRPNYHGSGNYGLKWVESVGRGKYYDLEVPDIEKGVDDLIARGLANPEKLGVLGWSNGGILTDALVVTNARFKVASAGAADVEWISDWSNVIFGAAFDNYYFGKAPIDDPELYIRKSPLFKLKGVQTPLLLFHGSEDFQVPPSQSWEAFRNLQQLGKTVKYIIFPGEPHGPQKLSHQRRKVEEELAWFDRYLFQPGEAANEALKDDSPLAQQLKRRAVKRVGRRYGLEVKSVLVPETVKYQGLEIGRFEVTRAQFSVFDKNYTVEPGTENYPASGITFENAQAYCLWLGKTTGATYRLGVEAEMEAIYKSAEGGENTLDYWAGYHPNPEDTVRLQSKIKELEASPDPAYVGFRVVKRPKT